MANSLIIQWLDVVNAVQQSDLGEEYKYKDSEYVYGQAGEALVAGRALYVLSSDGKLYETNFATALTLNAVAGTPIVAVASGSWFWRKKKGPREYKPNMSDRLDPALLADAGIVDGGLIGASTAVDGAFMGLTVGADGDRKCGHSRSATASAAIAEYFLNCEG